MLTYLRAATSVNTTSINNLFFKTISERYYPKTEEIVTNAKHIIINFIYESRLCKNFPSIFLKI